MENNKNRKKNIINMKTKNRGLSIIFLLLILISFANAYDLNGDGIDDGEQMMCGDTFCQPGEDITNCPTDCTNPSTPSSGDLTEIPSENNESIISNETTIPEEESIQENSFFQSTTFKIIILVLGLIVIGLIIYFIIRKKNNQIPETSNPTEQVTV